jgi:hypothetical protein
MSSTKHVCTRCTACTGPAVRALCWHHWLQDARLLRLKLRYATTVNTHVAGQQHSWPGIILQRVQIFPARLAAVLVWAR